MGEIMKKEYWKSVVGYEGLYEVSNWGRVKSFDTYRKGINGSIRCCKGKIIKYQKTKHGYLQVGLWKNGQCKHYYVHRLVAEAFIPNPNNLPIINHKDENKQNNIVSNLEWCTYQYNNTYGKMNINRNKQKKKILQYDLEGNFIKEWESIAECNRNGFLQSKIILCCQGERKTHKGFIWRYK